MQSSDRCFCINSICVLLCALAAVSAAGLGAFEEQHHCAVCLASSLLASNHPASLTHVINSCTWTRSLLTPHWCVKYTGLASSWTTQHPTLAERSVPSFLPISKACLLFGFSVLAHSCQACYRIQQLRYAYCLACEYVKTTFCKSSAIQFVTYSVDAVANNPGVIPAVKWLIETKNVVAIIGALTSEDCELLSAAFGSSLVCL